MKLKKKMETIKSKAIRNGGNYETAKYQYDIDNYGRLRRVELTKLDTTAMLSPDAWEYLED